MRLLSRAASGPVCSTTPMMKRAPRPSRSETRLRTAPGQGARTGLHLNGRHPAAGALDDDVDLCGVPVPVMGKVRGIGY